MNQHTSRRRVTYLGLAMFFLSTVYYCYEYWLRLAPSVMSAELQEFFDIGNPALGHLAACYYYAYVAMLIPVGIILDRYGVRRVLTAACGICVIGTFLFYKTDSFVAAQLGRFLMGLGSAFAYVGVLKVANQWFHGKYFGLAAGVCTSIGMVGANSGLIYIGSMVENGSWQIAMSWLAWMGLALTVILWFGLKDRREPVFPHHELEQAEARGGKRLLNSFVGMSISPKIWLSGLIGCLTYLPISAFAELWSVPYLEAAGYTKADAAFCTGMLFWGFGIGAPLWGIISAILNSRRIPLIIGSLVGAVASVFMVTMPQLSHIWMSVLFFICGAFASAQVLIFAVSNELCDNKISATAVAFTNMLVMSGGALLQPIIGVLLHLVSSGDITTKVVHATQRVQSYEAALLVLPMTLLLAAVLSLEIHEPRKQRAHKS